MEKREWTGSCSNKAATRSSIHWTWIDVDHLAELFQEFYNILNREKEVPISSQPSFSVSHDTFRLLELDRSLQIRRPNEQDWTGSKCRPGDRSKRLHGLLWEANFLKVLQRICTLMYQVNFFKPYSCFSNTSIMYFYDIF